MVRMAPPVAVQESPRPHFQSFRANAAGSGCALGRRENPAKYMARNCACFSSSDVAAVVAAVLGCSWRMQRLLLPSVVVPIEWKRAPHPWTTADRTDPLVCRRPQLRRHRQRRLVAYPSAWVLVSIGHWWTLTRLYAAWERHCCCCFRSHSHFRLGRGDNDPSLLRQTRSCRSLVRMQYVCGLLLLLLLV